MAHDEESCLVGGCLYTVLRLSRFHGVAPIDLKPLGNFYVPRISNSLVSYSWLLFTCISVAEFVALIMDLQFYGTNSAVIAFNISSIISCLSQIMMMKIIIGFGLYDARTRLKTFFRYLKQIEKVHKDMGCDLTQQFNEKTLSSGVICLIVVLYIAQIMYFGLYTYSTIEKTIIICLYGSCAIDCNMALLLLMQYACFVIRLQSAFKQINNRLRELMNTQELNIRRSIRDISNSYVQLCRIVREFNEEKAFSIFVIFTFATSSIFTFSHQLLIMLCLPDFGGEVRRWCNIIVTLIMISIYFTQILILIEPCHRTHEQMEETNVLLNKVTFHLTPIGCPVMFELEKFHMQVTLCKTAFSLLGVYTLHRILIATVISAYVAFIVFIKQYHIIVECK